MYVTAVGRPIRAEHEVFWTILDPCHQPCQSAHTLEGTLPLRQTALSKAATFALTGVGRCVNEHQHEFVGNASGDRRSARIANVATGGRSGRRRSPRERRIGAAPARVRRWHTQAQQRREVEERSAPAAELALDDGNFEK